MELKQKLYQECEKYINQRIQTIQNRLDSIEESKNNETKSSAGDKFETGRAMMQAEEAKSQAQLAEANLVRLTLTSLSGTIEKSEDTIKCGSLVTTTNGNYYITIGVGKVKIGNVTYYVVSEKSPIAQLMLGKKAKDVVSFNGREMIIQKIQ